MSNELCIGKLGAVAPFQAKEGTITITETAGIGGIRKEPVLSAAIAKGKAVTLDSEMTVKVAGSSDTIIGVAYNTPRWPAAEPRTNYTQAQATSAGMLREVAVETVFKKIETMDAKASEGITAGKYLVWKSTGFELSSSSGATETAFMALSAQDTNNRVIVGFL